MRKELLSLALLVTPMGVLAQGEVNQDELEAAMAMGERLAQAIGDNAGPVSIVLDSAEPAGSDPAAAIAAAKAALASDGKALCQAAEAQIVVVPAGGGSVDVFALSPAPSATSFPLAGHYRVRVSAAGDASVLEQMPGECVLADWSEGSEEDIAMQAAFIERPGEPQPTALDFYLSRRLPFSVGVISASGAWPVLGGLTDRPVSFD